MDLSSLASDQRSLARLDARDARKPHTRGFSEWRLLPYYELTAKMRDGVLEITVPLDESARPRRIQIED
jgi:hypothetical protein